MYSFIGDLHLGKRTPHSTVESNNRFWEYTLDKLHSVIQAHERSCEVIQLGDLFDKPVVDHITFVQAYKLLEHFDKSLFGNHDFNQDLTKPSALKMLSEMSSKFSNKVVTNPLREEIISFVGFQPTQEIFEETLKGVPAHDILCLHVNSPNHPDPGTTENSLTKEMLEELHDKFTYILSGHEHNFSHNGNLIMLGSFMPYSFGEMTDKKVAHYDSKTEKMTFETIWSASERYFKCTPQELLDLDHDHSYHFIEVTGETDTGEWAELTTKINRLFVDSPVFAIKDSTKMKGMKETNNTDEAEVETWQDMSHNRIKTEIGQEAADNFKRILNETK